MGIPKAVRRIRAQGYTCTQRKDKKWKCSHPGAIGRMGSETFTMTSRGRVTHHRSSW